MLQPAVSGSLERSAGALLQVSSKYSALGEPEGGERRSLFALKFGLRRGLPSPMLALARRLIMPQWRQGLAFGFRLELRADLLQRPDAADHVPRVPIVPATVLPAPRHGSSGQSFAICKDADQSSSTASGSFRMAERSITGPIA